jgi:hypothetical protein
MDCDDDPDLYRLEGSKNERGGLIIKKKPPGDSGVFKTPAPKKSILGLDRLAGNFFPNLFGHILHISCLAKAILVCYFTMCVMISCYYHGTMK